MDNAVFSAVAQTARKADPARFETAMFAPLEVREDLFALISLNVELSRIPETVSEPMLGEIRLQWWNDAIESLFNGGPIAGHEVITGLEGPTGSGRLPKGKLLDLVDARRLLLSDSPMRDDKILDRFIAQTGGAMAALQVGALGGDIAAQDVAADAGWTEGAGRLIAALPALFARGDVVLPASVNLDSEAIRSGDTPPELLEAVQRLASKGLAKLASARARRSALPRGCRSPLLNAHAEERRLKAVLKPNANLVADTGAVSPFRERLSLLMNALTGRF